MDASEEPVQQDPDVIGRNLAYARQREGLTLTELSRRARVSISTLSNVESGKQRGEAMAVGTVRRLCDTLSISMDWLTGRLRYDRGDDPSSLAPPAQDAAEMAQAEKADYIIRLVAESLERSRIQPPDRESIYGQTHRAHPHP